MNPDFRDLLSEFSDGGVESLIVGAHALATHGFVRATKDLDIWVRPSRDNARKIMRALTSFGAPLHDLSEEDLAKPGLIFQIGVPPLRIDIVTSIDGVSFDEAWLDRVQVQWDSVPVAVLSRRHLIMNKRASGRLQDLADLERLESLEKNSTS
jgi:hypothetical protein